MLQLKPLMQRLNLAQGTLASAVSVSRPALVALINHDKWPKSPDKTALQASIATVLTAHGAKKTDLKTAFSIVKTSPKNRQTPQIHTHKDETMLISKQTLNPATRKHFGLFRDPFDNDVQASEDVFMNSDTRYVREAMFQTARHGGFIAVCGESGAGKSTLRRDLADRINREAQPIMMVEPYVLGSEENDNKGKTMKAGHIAVAIMSTVAPLETVKGDPEARFRQLHRVLRDSSRAGNRHVLVIEEAHSLSVPVLKHLKRFMELEDGFKKLLSIILIGQPELGMRLSDRNYEVREVVQRCEMIWLQPLDATLKDYLDFKFKRIGTDLANVIDATGIDALRTKLTISGKARGEKSPTSLLYPLAVGNVLTAAMNLAASIGAPKVTADVIAGV